MQNVPEALVKTKSAFALGNFCEMILPLAKPGAN